MTDASRRKYDGEELDYGDPRVYKQFSDMFQSQDVKEDFFGASPPTIFVGRHGYPNVNVGVLSPMDRTDSAELDAPTQWYQDRQSVKSIVARRSSLVNSRTKSKVQETNKFADVAKEIAMARKPVDIEVGLKKKPKFDVSFNDRYAPYGPAENVQKVEIAENPSVSRAVEKAVGDTDWKAQGAMQYLYEKDMDTHKIQRVLSAGLLGQEDKRKLVPTRWSITASDDTVGKKIREDVKMNQELGEIRYFRSSYIGNHFHILLIPGQWEYELVEIKGAGSIWAPGKKSFIKSNHEGFGGRTTYADETSGGYYASRIGPLEYLQRINRQAKVLIIREVTDEYTAPLGVWVLRETIRGAFEGDGNSGPDYGVVEDVNTGLTNIKRQISTVEWRRIRQKSEMIQGMQSSLSNFF